MGCLRRHERMHALPLILQANAALMRRRKACMAMNNFRGFVFLSAAQTNTWGVSITQLLSVMLAMEVRACLAAMTNARASPRQPSAAVPLVENIAVCPG